jgi:hypothetical protein
VRAITPILHILENRLPVNGNHLGFLVSACPIAVIYTVGKRTVFRRLLASIDARIGNGSTLAEPCQSACFQDFSWETFL